MLILQWEEMDVLNCKIWNSWLVYMGPKCHFRNC